MRLQQAIYRLIEAETKKKMVASTREEYAFTTIDPAVTLEIRTAPKRIRIITLGLLIGLVIGVSIAVALQRQRKVASKPGRDTAD